MSLSIFAAALLGAATVHAQALGKSSWMQTFYGAVDTTLSSDLATAGGHTITQWAPGSLNFYSNIIFYVICISNSIMI